MRGIRLLAAATAALLSAGPALAQVATIWIPSDDSAPARATRWSAPEPDWAPAPPRPRPAPASFAAPSPARIASAPAPAPPAPLPHAPLPPAASRPAVLTSPVAAAPSAQAAPQPRIGTPPPQATAASPEGQWPVAPAQHTGVRFYSLHRDWGLAPDPDPVPKARPMVLVGPPDQGAKDDADEDGGKDAKKKADDDPRP